MTEPKESYLIYIFVVCYVLFFLLELSLSHTEKSLQFEASTKISLLIAIILYSTAMTILCLFQQNFLLIYKWYYTNDHDLKSCSLWHFRSKSITEFSIFEHFWNFFSIEKKIFKFQTLKYHTSICRDNLFGPKIPLTVEN